MANEILAQMSAGFEPLAGGQAPSMGPPIPALPYADQAMGPLGPLLTQLAAQQLMQSAGLNPIGVGFGMNPQDAMYRHQQYLLQQQLMMSASSLEREQYLRTAQGMATLAGMPFGPSERRALTPYLDFAMQGGPIFASMAPQLMDQMAGPTGSPMLMSYYMANAAPSRFDPVTGGYGMSGQSLEFYRNRLYNEMFEVGGLHTRTGVTAGDVGGMFQELSRRGLLPGGDPRADALAALSPSRISDLTGGAGIGGDPRGMSRSQLTALMENDGLRQEVGDFDVGRVRRSLESYAEVVSAMKDLLGANGEPNAPIQKILRDLDAIAQGNTAQMAPGRLADIVRNTHQLTQITGMSLDSAMMLQGHAGSRLSAAGLDPALAPLLTQGSLAWGGAMRANGIVPTYGGMSADERQQLDLNLRVNSADSQAANNLGALMRIREASGGFLEGSAAENIAQAVLSGNARGAYVSRADLFRALGDARSTSGASLGLREGDIAGYLGQDYTNREYAQMYDVFNLVREQQPLDVQQFASGRISQFVESRLLARGVGREDARRIANSQGAAIAASLQGMTEEDRGLASVRQDVIGRGLGDAFGPMSESARDVLSEELWGHLDRSVRGSEMRGYRNAANMFNASDPRTMADSRRLREQAALRGRLQVAMQGLNSDSVLRSAIGAIQNAGPDADLTTVLGRALGGVGDAELYGKIGEPLRALSGLEATAEDLLVRISGAATPEERAKLEAEFSSTVADIEARKAEASSAASAAGIVLNDSPLGADQLAEVRLASTSLSGNISKLAGEIGEGKTYATFGDFWDSDAAGRFRLSVDLSQNGLQDAVNTAINSPSTMARLGTSGITAAREARATSRELQTLADNYASGDVRRLLAGDLSTKDPKVRERISGQVQGILQRQQNVLKTLEGAGDSGAAVNRGLRRMGVNPGLYTAGVERTWDAMTPAQRLQARRAHEQGAAYQAELSRLGASGPDDPRLTPEQRAGLKALHESYGASVNPLMAATGGSAGDVFNVGKMQGDLDRAREREAALLSGDGGALLGEFERLSGIDIDENDAALRQSASGGQGWMLDTISSLRTIDSIRPGGMTSGQFMSELQSYALETDLGAKREKLKKLEGMGVTGSQLDQAAAAYTQLNTQGYLGIAGAAPDKQQSQLQRQLAASAGGAGDTQKLTGRITVDMGGEEFEGDFDGEVTR